MAGLAARSHPGRSEITYLAGLWSDDLLTSLLWESDTTVKDSHRIIPYMAPTWSWASNTGHVLWSMGYQDLLYFSKQHGIWKRWRDKFCQDKRVRVVAISVQWQGQEVQIIRNISSKPLASTFKKSLNRQTSRQYQPPGYTFGNMKSAKLTIRSRLFSVRITEASRNEWQAWGTFDAIRILGSNDATYEASGRGSLDVDYREYTWRHASRNDDGSPVVSIFEEDFFLLNIWDYHGFLLLRETTDKGCYERSGLFWYGGLGSDQSMEPVARRLGKTEQIVLV